MVDGIQLNIIVKDCLRLSEIIVLQIENLLPLNLV
jgi:hypothetical protein